MVFTTRLSGGKGGRNGLEHELRRLGIRQKNGKPNHPQTQGKVERFQQTLKNWLARQPPAATLTELQARPDAFTIIYNTQATPVPAAPGHPRHRLRRSFSRIAPAASADLPRVVAVQRGFRRAGGRSRTRTRPLARLGPGR